jgi:hypothetical protein
VIAGEELAASAWRRKWKCATCSETGSYESTGGARKGCTSYKADALEPQLARAGGDGTGARARGIALREIDTREGVRALGSLRIFGYGGGVSVLDGSGCPRGHGWSK